MIFIQFFLLAAIVVIGAIKLAKQAEIIESNSRMNAAFIGILLALTTSLPELATGLTSTLIGQPQMAIGNILGSNAFNFLIISTFNIIFFRKVIFSKIDMSATKLNIFTAIMYVLFLIAYVSTVNDSNIAILGRMTLTSIGLFVTYVFAIRTTSSIEDTNEHEILVDAVAYQKAKITFVATAIVILIASVLLAKNADAIVVATGLNASVVGAIFIGISTSLPELVTCYSLVKSESYTMAATSIWGSNLFNFAILTILDVFSKDPLLMQIDNDLLGLAILGICFAVIHFFQTKIGSKHLIINIIPSIVMILAYVLFFLVG